MKNADAYLGYLKCNFYCGIINVMKQHNQNKESNQNKSVVLTTTRKMTWIFNCIKVSRKKKRRRRFSIL